MLSLLDDTPQQTATDGAMQMDFGFGENTRFAGPNTYTTIASNPMFTSFASAFDTTPPAPAAESSSSVFNNFDMGALSAWSTPNPDNGAFDDLFGGFVGNNSIDYNAFNDLVGVPGSSISPVAHHASLSNNAAGRSPANSTTSSSSMSSDPLFNTPRESSSSESDTEWASKECPKTQSEMRSHLSKSDPSPFAPEPAPLVRKADSVFGPTVMCEGSAFPQTEQSEKNLEILTAWRTVTSNPEFRVSLTLSLSQRIPELTRRHAGLGHC
jgi:AP-1-like factor